MTALRLAWWMITLAVFARQVTGAGALTEAFYYDEATNRHLTVETEDFGKVSVVVRFVGGPGSSSRWFGDGERKDKEIIFSQVVGEDQDRGTYFLMKGGESKVEVAFKPGQRMPVDAGINGDYRRISPEKRFSLSRKEFDAADTYLGTLFKTAPKSWDSDDKPAAAAFRAGWPDLRTRWMGISYKEPAVAATTGKPPLGSVAKPGAPTGAEAQADYWIAMAETTGMAVNFIGQAHDKASPKGWDGEYDDGFGGHVSMKQQNNGGLRVYLTCSRGGDAQTGELGGIIPADKVPPAGAKELKAEYIHADPEVTGAEKQALIRLRLMGHYLYVESEHTGRYTARAWFDGIYKWSPPPVE